MAYGKPSVTYVLPGEPRDGMDRAWNGNERFAVGFDHGLVEEDFLQMLHVQ
jgi:hypothetical protein